MELKFDSSKIYLFHWGDLFYSEFEIQISIEAFNELIKKQEESLAQTKSKFQDAIKNDEELKSMSSEDQGGYYSAFYQREEITIKELQRQQRYSICLSIFSFYEGQLKSICALIERTFKFKIKVSDLNGNEDLMRYWNYLTKVFEIDTQKIESTFTPIRQQKIVRNIIAHQYGIAVETQLEKIKQINGLKVNKIGVDHQLEITDIAYLIYLVEKMDLFFKELLLSIDKRHKQLLPN